MLLLGQPGVGQGGMGRNGDEGGQHFGGAPDQKAVGDLIEPVQFDVGEQMMRHVLLEPDRFVAGDGSGQPGHDFAPVVFVVGDHFGRAGMGQAGLFQIMGVERFIGDKGIGAIAPRAHHGGGDVARPGPHGDSLGLDGHHRLNLSKGREPDKESFAGNVD